MFRFILRLLAASTSVVALLFTSSSTIAFYTSNNSVDQIQSATVNLNVVSPGLELPGNSKTLSNHLGCSCADCVQTIQSI